jgi:uncharacterized SAM-binding protein YcdF (DUF218 family)
MFFLKKCISAALLPPGMFVLILLIAACWLRRQSRPLAAGNCLLLALLIWALSTFMMADALTSRLEHGLTIPTRPRGDVIILLGGGINDSVPDLTGSGAPSEGMMARMVTAIRLQRQLDVPILVSGGAVYAGRSAEAPVVRRFLLDLGVPARQILVEDKSRDTVENARFSRVILQQHHFRQPLLVTSAYHMRRSLEAFRRVGIAVTPIPANFITAPGRPTVWANLLPDSGALHDTATALREYLGLLYYQLGGQGGT